jgi:hypothetical protein
MDPASVAELYANKARAAASKRTAALSAFSWKPSKLVGRSLPSLVQPRNSTSWPGRA